MSQLSPDHSDDSSLTAHNLPARADQALTDTTKGEAKTTVMPEIPDFDFPGRVRGQNTLMRARGLADPQSFMTGLLGKLDEVPEPDFPNFSIVGFGLVAQITADYPAALRVEVELTSKACGQKEVITQQVCSKVQEFLRDNPTFRFDDVQVDVLPHGSTPRNREWGMYYLDSDVAEAFTQISEDYMILAAAGYLGVGQIPDSIYRQAAELYVIYKNDSEVSGQIQDTAIGILTQYGLYGAFTANAEKVRTIQEENRSRMAETVAQSVTQ